MPCHFKQTLSNNFSSPLYQTSTQAKRNLSNILDTRQLPGFGVVSFSNERALIGKGREPWQPYRASLEMVRSPPGCWGKTHSSFSGEA